MPSVHICTSTLKASSLLNIFGSSFPHVRNSLRQPLVVHESINALRLLELLRKSPLQVGMVLGEFGSVEGMVTPTDLLEAIAGDFADDDDEDQAAVERGEHGSLLVDGWIDIRHVSKLLDVDLVDDTDGYFTLACLILWRLEHMPAVGEKVAFEGWSMK
jgi:CBS domain containing-hemolysin-like protein